MSIKIGLAGNPNCGKTTLFNTLTGSTQYVGNWPGVTVEKKGGKLKGYKDVEIVDLPGIYSLSPYTLEEVVTRNFILDDHPDAIINIVDASNLERNLYLTTQILELGVPTIIALNMMDVVEKSGDQINLKAIEKRMGCPVVAISALKNTGIKELTKQAVNLAQSKKIHHFVCPLDSSIENAIVAIEQKMDAEHLSVKVPKRYLAIKLFERDKAIIKKYTFQQQCLKDVEEMVKRVEREYEDDSESIITGERYAFIGAIGSEIIKKKVKGVKESMSDKIDKIVTNRILALPIFALIMWFVYYISVSTLGAVLTDWTNDTLFGEIIQGSVSSWMEAAGTADWLQGLVVDGLIGGVGAVLGFVPQIMLLFLFLAILEDCGYMARIAFIMDRLFRRFGLSGKSFIPMLISSGCGVPGIMATRTLENDRDRKMTIMLTTFIPCGAKIPIIALFAGAMFGGASWVAPAVYFLGVGMIIICGIILKQTKGFKGEAAPFVMELPQYHVPSAKNVLLHMWDRGKAFIIKAGTIIFVACGIIWFLQSFSWSLEMVEGEESILASIGNVIAPIFRPLGFGDWRAAVATITGLVAKENVVATYGVVYGIGEVSEDGAEYWTQIAASFTAVTAFAFIAFNMLCAPCFAAIGAIKREMGSWKWTFITIGFQTLTAYIVALLINQVGSAILYGGSMVGAAISIIIAIAAVVLAVTLGKGSVKGNSMRTLDSMVE